MPLHRLRRRRTDHHPDECPPSPIGMPTNHEELTMEELAMNRSDTNRRAPSIKYQPRSRRYYFDVGIGSVCLGGADTGGAYCLLEVSLAPGMGVPRHTHTREDETYYILAGERKSSSETRSSFSRQAILSSRRATSHTNCAILATPRTTISLCSRLPGSKSF
jgi:mannose-6-phosphate isomerase-like protein (cupin superfamily)